jgi:hypothetical protein
MKLTDTQVVILAAAAEHPEHLAIPPGRLPAGARQNVAQALLRQDLVIAVHPPAADAIALRPVDGAGVLLKTTDEGRRAIGIEAHGKADDAERGGPEAAEFDAERELAQRALDAGVDLGAPDAVEQAQPPRVWAAREAGMPARGATQSAETGQPSPGSHQVAEGPPKPLTARPESRTGLLRSRGAPCWPLPKRCF